MSQKIKIIKVFCYLVIAMAIFDGLFAMPSADDFIYAQRSEQYGVLGAVVFEFNHWAGRYFSTFLLTSFSHFFNIIDDFWLVPVSLILLSLVSFYSFINALSTVFVLKYKNILVLLLFIIYLLTIPRLSQTFYWLAGGFTYQVGNILFMFAATLWLKYSQSLFRSFLSKAFFLVGNIILVILYSGTNETLALVSIVILSYIILYELYFRKKISVFFLTLFLVNVLMVLIMVTSPGVAERGGEQLGQVGFIMSFVMSYFSGVKFLLLSCIILFLITASSSLREFSNLVISSVNPVIRKLLLKEKLIIIFFYVSLFAVVYFPGYWARGEEPPQRSLNILVLLAVLGWYPLLGIIMSLLKVKEFKYPYINATVNYNLMSIIFVSLFLVKLNFYLIVSDLYLAPRSYYEQKEIISWIVKEKQSGNKDLYVSALKTNPKLVRTIIDNESQWRNDALASYFNVKSITVKNN